MAEEPASAGEELLERELKGDCLKHSSRKGLERNTHNNASSKTSSPLKTEKKKTLPGSDLPVYSYHATVFVVVGFADLFWKRQKQKDKFISASLSETSWQRLTSGDQYRRLQRSNLEELSPKNADFKSTHTV